MKVGDRMVYTKVSELNDNWHYCMTEQEYKKLREMILYVRIFLLLIARYLLLTFLSFSKTASK